MRVISMTLVGAGGDIVADAIASVAPWVDQCLLVDTGAGDGTIEAAIAAAGDKAVVRQFAWCDDFAAARNFCLEQAQALGADWAVTVDADERLLAGEVDMRAALAAADAGCLLVMDDTGTYAKERFFRLPCPVRFHGPTHESFASYTLGAHVMDGVRFTEVTKDEAAVRAKRARDLEILTAHTAGNPDDPRWWYYLGDALQGLGRFGEAIDAYDHCQALGGWAEEAAWACYRAADCAMELGDLDGGVRWCATGLTHHAGMAELPWLAGVCCFRLGRHHDAIAWARQAEALGMVAGMGDQVARIGFRHPPALWEGPYDVLRFALAALDDTAGAAQAQAAYERALAARLAGGATPG